MPKILYRELVALDFWGAIKGLVTPAVIKGGLGLLGNLWKNNIAPKFGLTSEHPVSQILDTIGNVAQGMLGGDEGL